LLPLRMVQYQGPRGPRVCGNYCSAACESI